MTCFFHKVNKIESLGGKNGAAGKKTHPMRIVSPDG